MNRNTIIALAVAVGSAASAQASDVQQNAPFSFCSHIKDSFRLFDQKRDNAENPYIQEFSLKARGQYQWGYLDPAGGTDRLKGAAQGRDKRDNYEWRRFRLGAQAKVLEHFTVKSVWNIGGLDSRYKFSNGGWNRSSTSASVDEFCVTGKFKPVAVTLGKHKPAYMGEYRTSSGKIMTLERSVPVNQLKAEKLYGISVANADSKDKFGWNIGVWANGQHDSNTWLEPAFNSDDNAMVGASVSYATGEKSRLYLDYMHSFYNQDGSQADSEYAGPGARDVVALTWEAKKDKLSFMAEALAGFHVFSNAEAAENVYGLVLMPTYRFSPHWEGVLRYQIASGSNAVNADSRYYTTNSSYSGTSDLLQGVYMGANYYVCPKDPHMMKLMAGAEYFNSHGTDAKGNKGFTGWQLSTAVRFDF